MTYETVATFSQVTSLLLFIGLFVVVVAIALNPKNRIKWEEAQRKALDMAGDDKFNGGRP